MTAYYRAPYDDAVVTDVAPDLLRDVILPTELLASDECSDDYRHLYATRVEEEIARDHTALRQALGEGRFAALVRNFLASERSSRNLARASARFAEFLRAEAQRDPGVWIARTIALHRRTAVERARPPSGRYPELRAAQASLLRRTARSIAGIQRRAS
jgi:hypothetical protein